MAETGIDETELEADIDLGPEPSPVWAFLRGALSGLLVCALAVLAVFVILPTAEHTPNARGARVIQPGAPVSPTEDQPGGAGTAEPAASGAPSGGTAPATSSDPAEADTERPADGAALSAPLDGPTDGAAPQPGAVPVPADSGGPAGASVPAAAETLSPGGPVSEPATADSAPAAEGSDPSAPVAAVPGAALSDPGPAAAGDTDAPGTGAGAATPDPARTAGTGDGELPTPGTAPVSGTAATDPASTDQPAAGEPQPEGTGAGTGGTDPGADNLDLAAADPDATADSDPDGQTPDPAAADPDTAVPAVAPPKIALAGPAIEVNASALKLDRRTHLMAIILDTVDAGPGRVTPEKLRVLETMPITLGLADGPGAGQLASVATSVGHEVLVRLPVRAAGAIDGASPALAPGMAEDAVRAITLEKLAPLQTAVGAFAHPGVTDTGLLEAVLATLDLHGFAYVDARPLPQAGSGGAARTTPVTRIDFQADQGSDEIALKALLDSAMYRARQSGEVVVLLPDTPTVVNVIAQWGFTAQANGQIRLVPISAVINRRNAPG